MKAELIWKDGMAFEAQASRNKLSIDAKAPLGKGLGPTPKELVVMGIGGCTGMDVVALMKKYRQPLTKFVVNVDVETTSGKPPSVFKSVRVVFRGEGEVEAEKLIEAVRLSQTQYCGVSAMIAKGCPIQYEIHLNGKAIGSGEAQFS